MALKLTETPFAGAMDVISRAGGAADSYRLLLSVLEAIEVPRQTKVKASPAYVFDQTALQAAIRGALTARGWKHDVELAPPSLVDGVRLSGIRSDLIGPGCVVVLDFGNRTSWAHNLVTRVVGSLHRVPDALAVFVTPTDAFARRIDSNLGTFERVTSELRHLACVRPQMLPGPLFVLGVEPREMPRL